ncbi:MAG: tetratricopeptide repeat protein [Planctomycetota bacterium]|jgi:tetratricopeptide (TPR) repeat protein
MRLRWLAMGVVALCLCTLPSIAGDGAWPRYEEGIRALRDGDIKTAQQRFESALVADPNFCDAHYRLGQICERRRDVRGAVARYKKVEKKWPTYPLAQERLGQIAIKLGDKKAAEHCFKEVVDARPNLDAWLQYASVLLDLKKYKEAEAALDEAKKRAPNDLRLLDQYGRLYLETDRFPQALVVYTTIAEKMPRDATAHYMKALCLKELGREADSVEVFEKVLDIDPFHKGTILRLIATYQDDPRKDARVADLERRLEMIKKRPAPVRRVSGTKKREKAG